MAKAFDGTIVPNELPKMACGGTPLFDHGSGYAYRCDTIRVWRLSDLLGSLKAAKK